MVYFKSRLIKFPKESIDRRAEQRLIIIFEQKKFSTFYKNLSFMYRMSRKLRKFELKTYTASNIFARPSYVNYKREKLK